MVIFFSTLLHGHVNLWLARTFYSLCNDPGCRQLQEATLHLLYQLMTWTINIFLIFLFLSESTTTNALSNKIVTFKNVFIGILRMSLLVSVVC